MTHNKRINIRKYACYMACTVDIILTDFLSDNDNYDMFQIFTRTYDAICHYMTQLT